MNLDFSWLDEITSYEIFVVLNFFLIFFLISRLVFYPDVETISYELFMWGDIGIYNDIRFFGVAPHWYFRPYMAWLTSCPYHKIGLFGIILFFFLFFFQPNIFGKDFFFKYKKKNFFFF